MERRHDCRGGKQWGADTGTYAEKKESLRNDEEGD